MYTLLTGPSNVTRLGGGIGPATQRTLLTNPSCVLYDVAVTRSGYGMPFEYVAFSSPSAYHFTSKPSIRISKTVDAEYSPIPSLPSNATLLSPMMSVALPLPSPRHITP